MNKFVASLCFLAVVSAHGTEREHNPSGFVSVHKDGAVVAGPAGSVHIGVNGASGDARLSGPAGDIRTQDGRSAIIGPGYDHIHKHWAGDNTHQWNNKYVNGLWHGDTPYKNHAGQWYNNAWNHGYNGQWHGGAYDAACRHGAAWNHGRDGVWRGDGYGLGGQWRDHGVWNHGQVPHWGQAHRTW